MCSLAFKVSSFVWKFVGRVCWHSLLPDPQESISCFSGSLYDARGFCISSVSILSGAVRPIFGIRSRSMSAVGGNSRRRDSAPVVTHLVLASLQRMYFSLASVVFRAIRTLSTGPHRIEDIVNTICFVVYVVFLVPRVFDVLCCLFSLCFVESFVFNSRSNIRIIDGLRARPFRICES